MYKCLKKTGISIVTGLSIYLVSLGFVHYISLDWNVSVAGNPVESIFTKFRHIKYPMIFSKIKNLGMLSSASKKLRLEIVKIDKRILKVFSNASSLFYLDYLPIEPIKKEFKPIEPKELAKLLGIKEPSFMSAENKIELLYLDNSFEEERIVYVTPSRTIIKWTKFYEEMGIGEEILSYAEFFNNETKVVSQGPEDLVKLVQSATKRSSVDSNNGKEDSLVFFSYQEKEKPVLSSVVLKAIEREVKRNKPVRLAQVQNRTVQKPTAPEVHREEKRVHYKAKMDMLETEVITIGVQIDKKIMDQVSGIEFVPHYDKNERFYDEAEGVLRLSGNMKKSDYIYGTFLGKDFVNMRTSIPLYLGGGVFEVPLIEKESLNILLDKEGLTGLGSFLLIDLGESAIDVDIDKKFEARTFLNEEFRVTTQEKSYKYILYVGVEPGNTVVRYLESSGATFEKLTFLADSELTFEYFSYTDTFTFKFETFELSPLSREPKELGMPASKISLFSKEENPKQIGLNSFIFENHKVLKSSNSYIEFNHLGDTIFAGMRYSNYVILPSANFIETIINAEDLESLDNHCMIQLNLSKPVKTILFDGEDSVGPMRVLLHYLDEDGVLSEEPSLLSKHAFIIGNGQGVINIQVEFLNGSKLIAQSFCSEGTYLVEQL